MFEYEFGATPLDPNEVEGLIPSHITNQQQLNEWEQANILEVEEWTNRHKFITSKVLTIEFIRRLHLKMFNKTWRWAGKFRKSNKNIGVHWSHVSTELKNLNEDVKYQIKHDVYPIDEIAARFHHRLVYIHPFANGNGRHARLMSDIFLLSQNHKRFSWGNKSNFTVLSNIRKKYIQALRAADKMDYSLLIDFLKK